MKLPARYKCDWCGIETECRDGDAFVSDYPEGWSCNSAANVEYCGECISYLLGVLPWMIKDRLAPDRTGTELKDLLPLLHVLTRTDFDIAKILAAEGNDGEAQETTQEA